MKNVVLASVAAFALIMSGCSQKNPEVDAVSSSESQSSGSDLSGHDSGSSSDYLTNLTSQLDNDSRRIYFDFDKFNIRPDMQLVIKNNADLLNSPEAQSFSVKVEGNCDEWGTDEYNYALGLKRAKSAKEALIANGVSSERIMIVSFGESNPVCTEKTKSCWAKNRRDDLKVLP